MTSDEILQELQKVYASLKALEAGTSIAMASSVSAGGPELTVRQAFKRDEVICMVCGKGGFKTLKRHLSMSHALKPGQYRKQFGIPSTQSLAAKSYSESRRQMAIDKGLGEGLAKARAMRVAKKSATSAVTTIAAVHSKTKKKVIVA
jgi:predicted transcriptional regulator